MTKFISKPTIIQAASHPPKIIEEFIGGVNSGTELVSIARMKSPSGWSEPAQTPDFDEYTVVIKGILHVKTKDGEFDVSNGQAIIIPGGKWVQYSSHGEEGAEYIAICTPAFFSRYRSLRDNLNLLPAKKETSKKNIYQVLNFRTFLKILPAFSAISSLSG